MVVFSPEPNDGKGSGRQAVDKRKSLVGDDLIDGLDGSALLCFEKDGRSEPRLFFILEELVPHIYSRLDTWTPMNVTSCSMHPSTV